MSKQIHLSIADPCHENWDNMSPSEKGRFCGSCQKQVVDFTNMSDSQIATFFKKPSTGSVCGRFYNDQLDKDIEIPRKHIPWVKYFFQFTLPAFLLSMKAAAQSKPVAERVIETRMKLGEVGPMVIEAPIAKQITIQGRVVGVDNKPVPFASIMVKGIKGMGTAADSSGRFSFSQMSFVNELVLEVSSVGFETKQITITKEKDFTKDIIVQLIASQLDKVVVVGYESIRRRDATMGYVCTTIGETIVVTKDSLVNETPVEKISVVPSLKLFPNPVQRSNMFTIEFKNEKDEPMQLAVFAMNGSLVFQQPQRIIKGSNRISVTTDARWSAGIYIVQLRNEKGSVVKQEKLIVQ